MQFTNESSNSNAYNWDFGDGEFSTLENPVHIFQQAGIYGVRLYASNSAGEESILQSVTIYEPTSLGFLVFESPEENLLQGAAVWVYDNESDWENRNEPLMEGFTDNEGMIIFYNMEPVVYHIWAIKEGAGGSWIFGGYTSTILQNKINLFNVQCIWFPDEKK